jgi:hypothetical protein
MALSAALAIVSVMVNQAIMVSVALVIAVAALGYYIFSMAKLFTSKPRRYSDIWERSVVTAFVALILSGVLGVYGYFGESEKFLMISFWLLIGGFFGFLISGHLYKIVPFLVWFERFAPYIDEREVPMLHQLLPEKWANAQWIFALIGVVLCSMAIGFEQPLLLPIGSVLMIFSGMILMGIILKIVSYR